MVHTAQFYCVLKKEDISKIDELFNGISFKSVQDYLNEKYQECVIKFKKSYNKWNIYIVADFIKILKKPDIIESDYILIEQYFTRYLGNLNLLFSDLILIRIDYRVDCIVKSVFEREVLLNIYHKGLKKFGFKIKKSIYFFSVYYNTKSLNLIIYDKEKELNEKNIIAKSYEKNVIRFECRLLNKHFNENKRKKNWKKNFKTYFKTDLFRHYMYKNFSPILYYGDYMNIHDAHKTIDSSTLKSEEKIKLGKFITHVSVHGITNSKLFYTKYKFNKFISELGKLNINPILIGKIINPRVIIKNPFPKELLLKKQ